MITALCFKHKAVLIELRPEKICSSTLLASLSRSLMERNANKVPEQIVISIVLVYNLPVKLRPLRVMAFTSVQTAQ
jgi:hypothetical protein